jgi:hypothetical protein
MQSLWIATEITEQVVQYFWDAEVVEIVGGQLTAKNGDHIPCLLDGVHRDGFRAHRVEVGHVDTFLAVARHQLNPAFVHMGYAEQFI